MNTPIVTVYYSFNITLHRLTTPIYTQLYYNRQVSLAEYSSPPVVISNINIMFFCPDTRFFYLTAFFKVFVAIQVTS